MWTIDRFSPQIDISQSVHIHHRITHVDSLGVAMPMVGRSWFDSMTCSTPAAGTITRLSLCFTGEGWTHTAIEFDRFVVRDYDGSDDGMWWDGTTSPHIQREPVCSCRACRRRRKGTGRPSSSAGTKPLITLFYIQWTFDFIVSFCCIYTSPFGQISSEATVIIMAGQRNKRALGELNNDYGFLIVVSRGGIEDRPTPTTTALALQWTPLLEWMRSGQTIGTFLFHGTYNYYLW